MTRVSRVMISRLAGLFRRAKPPQVPSGSRVYAIGDVHGRVDLLQRMQALIQADTPLHPDKRKVIVFLGDFIDRGPNSRDVVETLAAWDPPDCDLVCLRGNHEAVLLDFLAGADTGAQWLSYGGLEAILSYGVALERVPSTATAFEDLRHRLLAAIPDHHVAWLESLPLTHQEGDYMFVHAGVRPRIPLDQQEEQDLLWIRDEFLTFGGTFGAMVVHGHSIRYEAEVKTNRIGIDTGAYATGRLTCLVLEGERRWLLTAG